MLEAMQTNILPNTSLIWMHCASLGEFEQGRPLLEKLRERYPSYKILLTFFSPSGYEVRKDYNGADFIYYLPMDSKKNAQTFLNITNPALIIFVKYEFWYHYLTQANQRQIPLFLVSAIFRRSQPFFSKHQTFYRNILAAFTHIFVQNKESVSLLKTIGFEQNVVQAGDTRFDRVIEIAEGFQPIAVMEAFCKNSNVIVAGSTWSGDDRILSNYANIRKDLKFIIAPHSIHYERLEECKRLYKNAVLFSSLSTTSSNTQSNIIIIDNIGMLSQLYKYSTISFIGGGFGADGVHNVLEAAVFGKPVVFGPKYGKFLEAVELVVSGGGFSIKNNRELEQKLDSLLNSQELYSLACQSSINYVYSKQGATQKILQVIQEKRLLTS